STLRWTILVSIRSGKSEPKSRRMTRLPIGVVSIRPIDCSTCAQSLSGSPVLAFVPMLSTILFLHRHNNTAERRREMARLHVGQRKRHVRRAPAARDFAGHPNGVQIHGLLRLNGLAGNPRPRRHAAMDMSVAYIGAVVRHAIAVD